MEKKSKKEVEYDLFLPQFKQRKYVDSFRLEMSFKILESNLTLLSPSLSHVPKHHIDMNQMS